MLVSIRVKSLSYPLGESVVSVYLFVLGIVVGAVVMAGVLSFFAHKMIEAFDKSLDQWTKNNLAAVSPAAPEEPAYHVPYTVPAYEPAVPALAPQHDEPAPGAAEEGAGGHGPAADDDESAGPLVTLTRDNRVFHEADAENVEPSVAAVPEAA